MAGCHVTGNTHCWFTLAHRHPKSCAVYRFTSASVYRFTCAFGAFLQTKHSGLKIIIIISVEAKRPEYLIS